MESFRKLFMQELKAIDPVLAKHLQHCMERKGMHEHEAEEEPTNTAIAVEMDGQWFQAELDDGMYLLADGKEPYMHIPEEKLRKLHYIEMPVGEPLEYSDVSFVVHDDWTVSSDFPPYDATTTWSHLPEFVAWLMGRAK